jgi:hypothetical protein
MESLDQRMKDRQAQGQQGKNQQGQQGKDGQGQRAEGKGQQGQQGQSGQQGKDGQQGQGGQQGQNAQGGQNGGGGARDGNNAGSPNSAGAYGGDARNNGYYGGGNGRWNADDIRQWRGQFREYANDAETLRRQLQTAGVNPRDMDDVLRRLREMDNDKVYADPRGLEQLQAAVVDQLKKVEFALRRATEAGNESLSLSGSDQVPEGFRQAIEEYYRSLSKKPAPQQPQK